MNYMLYAKAGQEFEVAETIRALFCDVICEKKINTVRRGNDRRARIEEVPYLPNYLFAEIPDSKLHTVLSIKHLSSHAVQISNRAMKSVRNFQEAAQEEYKRQERAAKSREYVCEFEPGQAVKLIDSQVMDAMLTFRAIEQRPYDPHPMLKLEVEVMGRIVPVYADPLTVREA